MPQRETRIYTARTIPQARRLREALQAAGIDARVLQPPEGDEPASVSAGRPGGVGVVVAEGDALAARQIAAEFAEQGHATPEDGGFAPPPPQTTPTEAEGGVLPDWWPTCPGCGARRSTACPFCGTAGTRFEPIDMGFSLIEGLDDMMGASGPSCGPGGCTVGPPADSPPAGSSGAEPPAGQPASGEPPSGEHAASGRTAPEPSAAESELSPREGESDMAEHMVICPTCDEPFRPEHPKRCEWCGHEFSDGVDMPLPDDEDDTAEFTGRVYAAIGVLLAIGLAGLLYFRFVIY